MGVTVKEMDLLIQQLLNEESIMDLLFRIMITNGQQKGICKQELINIIHEVDNITKHVITIDCMQFTVVLFPLSATLKEGELSSCLDAILLANSLSYNRTLAK